VSNTVLEFSVAAIIVCLVVLLSTQMRSAFAIFAVFLPLVMWLPRILFRFGPVELGEHLGIAPSVAGISGWSIVLIIGLIAVLVRQTLPPFTLAWVLPIGFLLFAYTFWWPHNDNVTSGVMHWILALCAWVVGHYCGRFIDITGVLGLRMAQLFAVIFAVELAVSLFQLATGGGNLGRMTGMYTHPGFLGKAVVVCMVVMLPLTLSRRTMTRRWAFAAVAMSVAATGLTLSRTNIIAALLIIVVWSLFLPGTRSLGSRLAMPLLAALVVLPMAGLVLDRFAEDPEGGSRPRLLEAGLRVLEKNLMMGLGPNGFVDGASPTEPVIKQLGFPVHNTFILGAAELGVFGALLVALPLLVVLITAFVRFGDKDPTKAAFARSVIIVGGALLFVGYTSWGVLQIPSLDLIFFLFGFAFAQLMKPKPNDLRNEAVLRPANALATFR